MSYSHHQIKQAAKKSMMNLLLFSSLLAVFSSVSHAELQLMDESSLAKITAQSGLTIDIETQVTIAEIEYVDDGSMFWSDYSLSGIGGGLMDNIRATIDSTNGTDTLATGFSDAAFLASHGYLDATEADVAWAITEYSDGLGGFGKQYNDGDLLIHVTSQDFGIDFSVPANPGDQASNLVAMKNAIDFHLQQGEFGIRSEDKLTETVLTSNFSVEAYLGYFDILLTNNGNGFHDTGFSATDGAPQNIQLNDSYIGLDLRFRVEDLDIDNTNNVSNPIIPFVAQTPYLTLRDMRIHNERGVDTLGKFGFASFESKIGAASGVLNQMDQLVGPNTHVDGQAIYDINIAMDWDLPHISFGDTNQTIGAVYITDMIVSDTSMIISAH